MLQNANWRCQIAREGRCTGRATVYDHHIAVKMLDLIPPAIRPTRAELDEPWNAQAACEPCSRWKASMEGHYVAGHDVECPFEPGDHPRPDPQGLDELAEHAAIN